MTKPTVKKPRAQRLLTKLAPTLRRTADRVAGLLDHPAPAASGLVIKDIQLANIPARQYVPSAPKKGMVLFVHGGGWLMGGPQAHGSLMQQIATSFNRSVISLEYGLAPEVPVDIAFEQVCQALEFLWSVVDEPIYVMGESAGAMMAAHAALHHPEKMAGLILVCPILDFTRAANDLPARGALAGVVKTVVNFLWPLWSDLTKSEQSALSPMVQELPVAHPSVLLIAANADPLKMDAVAYEKKLERAKVDVTLKIYPRVTHGFFSVARVSKAGRDAVGAIGSWIDDRPV
jgi:acetyl esterase